MAAGRSAPCWPSWPWPALCAPTYFPKPGGQRCNPLRVPVSRQCLRNSSCLEAAGSSVRVQVLVERDPATVAGHHLDRTGHRIAPEQHVAAAGELTGLNRIPVGHNDFGARRDIQDGLDDAVVTQ